VAHDHNDIYNIVGRLRLIETNLSPTTTKKGLTAQQKSVPQLPALFRPKHIAVLGTKKDPKHPMAGYAVGAEESVKDDQAILEAEMAEDVLEKVKKSFTEFIKHVEDEINDSDIKEKKKEDTDLKNKDKKDQDLIVKAAPVAEDPTQQDMSATAVTVAPVKSISLSDDMICEIHGNDRDGFEIRRGDRSLPTRFKNIEQAEMAVEMYRARMKQQNEAQDYMEER